VVRMVDAMDAAGFGACTNHGECMAACPKEIPLDFIAQLNRDVLKATLVPPREGKAWSGAA
jgi:succinate dehydrogenase iron-sulfur subunit